MVFSFHNELRRRLYCISYIQRRVFESKYVNGILYLWLVVNLGSAFLFLLSHHENFAFFLDTFRHKVVWAFFWFPSALLSGLIGIDLNYKLPDLPRFIGLLRRSDFKTACEFLRDRVDPHPCMHQLVSVHSVDGIDFQDLLSFNGRRMNEGRIFVEVFPF